MDGVFLVSWTGQESSGTGHKKEILQPLLFLDDLGAYLKLKSMPRALVHMS